MKVDVEDDVWLKDGVCDFHLFIGRYGIGGNSNIVLMVFIIKAKTSSMKP